MILEYLDLINSKNVVLASQSPRRKEILERIGLRFSITSSSFEENLDKSKFTPEEYVQENALQKAKEVAERLGDEADIVIGSDTVVVCDDTIMEKPKDADDAIRTLKRLSGRAHEVLSGVCIIYGNATCTFVEETKVRFAELSDEEIVAYVATGEPMDKAGSYGIQARAGAFVSGIDGCYYNVMGFPLHHFCQKLKKMLCVSSK
eukprot:TRINITY_DN775885_c0_g1_i1.p1 TRINITY_DN775885_c0_g1~~TRINITY_DN775885_c0_g1_i1.p1  ORF type:complete len:204 (-),score=55.94 TRINITY_DN775885_c0_g1_i1:190-801(-)